MKKTAVKKYERWKWKYASRVRADAQASGEFMQDISIKYGKLDARLLLDKSRPVSTPLHDEFEWDDEIAGELYREVEARKILRSIVSVHHNSEGEEIETRAYFALHEPETHEVSYIPIARILSDEELSRELLHQALGYLKQMQKRYGGIKELTEIFSIADDLSRKFEDD